MVTEPKVSVFIACYNHARYLPECLDSILAQTYQDFEIVIVDDGSTDNSLEIMEDYQRRYPDIVRVFFHPDHANRGVSASSNLALSKTRGEYLAWTGSDDVWYPERLRLEVERLDREPHAGMVYSYADYINENGVMLPGQAGIDITGDENPVGRMLQSCHPPAMTVMIRRDCLNSVGVFDELLQTCEDWDLWIRVFSHWKVAFISQALVKYRIHRTNLSKGVDPKLYLSSVLKMYQRLEQKLSAIGGTAQQNRNLAIFHLQLVFHLFCDDRKDESFVHIQTAIKLDHGLLDDLNFIDRWLNQWKPSFYTTEHSHFGLWFIAALPTTMKTESRHRLLVLQLNNTETKAFFVERGIQRGLASAKPVDYHTLFNDCSHSLAIPQQWKQDILRQVYSALLYKTYEAGDRNKVRMYWGRAIRSDWRQLSNRGVLAIGLKTLISARD